MSKTSLVNNWKSPSLCSHRRLAEQSLSVRIRRVHFSECLPPRAVLPQGSLTAGPWGPARCGEPQAVALGGWCSQLRRPCQRQGGTQSRSSFPHVFTLLWKERLLSFFQISTIFGSLLATTTYLSSQVRYGDSLLLTIRVQIN